MTKKTKQTPQRMLDWFLPAYNLRRIFNLIDHKLLKQYLRILLLYFGNHEQYLTLLRGLFYFNNHKASFNRTKFKM
jgi:hypothetical protein